jgi:UDP-N-acetylmuramoyl-tripeptide--D-alanyl-D-alanine ligase
VEVADTLFALGEIAREWRRRNTLPVLAITGSVGKTTTKEMVAGILGYSRPVFKTTGNLNTRIGLPLMLLELAPHHQVGVVEMGMNEPGEIDRLCQIAMPQFGLITQVAPAHLEGMGSIEGVAMAKGELFRALGMADTAIVNVDDPWIVRQARDSRARQVTFGRATEAVVRLRDERPFQVEGARWILSIGNDEREIRMQCHGRPFVLNGLAAAAAGWTLGASIDEIVRGLSDFRPFSMRGNRIVLGNDIQLIDDSYNANPSAMAEALETFCRLAQGRTLAVLGEMRELGEQSASAHREVGKLAADLGVKILILVGHGAREMQRGAEESSSAPEEIQVLDSARDALETVIQVCSDGDWILVKGSRNVGLEAVVAGLETRYGLVNQSNREEDVHHRN